jgi:hypothetical protein
MPSAVMHRLIVEAILHGVLPASQPIDVHLCQAFCQFAPRWTAVRGHSLINHKCVGRRATIAIAMNKVGTAIHHGK